MQGGRLEPAPNVPGTFLQPSVFIHQAAVGMEYTAQFKDLICALSQAPVPMAEEKLVFVFVFCFKLLFNF